MFFLVVTGKLASWRAPLARYAATFPHDFDISPWWLFLFVLSEWLLLGFVSLLLASTRCLKKASLELLLSSVS